ncbi:MAG TPA: amidohydrolase [Chloroflexi bacterium]|nr:amidohydrolase [Chloroflexota bacterium]HHW86778.1 amidohydrolase family protein [Chloroflexota bacterium]
MHPSPLHPSPLIVWAGLAVLDAQAPVQRDYGVCVVGNRIVDVGSHIELQERYPDATFVGGADLCLLPGLVNSHDHGRALSSVALGVADDLLEVWLMSLGALPAIDPTLLAQLEGVTLLRSGVTATAHSHNPSSWDRLPAECAPTIHGYRAAGIRVAFHPPYVDQNPLLYAGHAEFVAGLSAEVRPLAQAAMQLPALSPGDYFSLCSELYNRFHDAADHTIHIQISPAGGVWCSDTLILEACDWAKTHSTRVQMHLLETRYQATYARRRWNKSFVQHLDEIGALGPWLTLAHMVWLEDGDIEILRSRSVAIAHNPSSNLRLRSGIAPLPDLLAAGIEVGVGLDGYALDDDQDYLRELRLAWTLANRPGATSPTVAAADILHAGTVGGAAVTFGADALLGRLGVGALADCVLLDWQGLVGVWMSPLASPVDVLLRRANRTHVRHVMVNGEWVVRAGRATRIDEAALIAEVRAALHRASRHEQHGLGVAQLLAPHVRRFYASWDAAE